MTNGEQPSQQPPLQHIPAPTQPSPWEKPITYFALGGFALVVAGLFYLASREPRTPSQPLSLPAAPAKKQLLIMNTLPEASRGAYATDWNIKDNALAQVSSKNETYNLESIVSKGQRFYVTKNREQYSDELDFALLDAAKTSLVIDDTPKTVAPETDTFYIPTLYQNEEGKVAHTFTFTPEGPYALQAKRTDMSLGIDGIDMAIAHTGNSEISYTIKSFKINGREFYAPFRKVDNYTGATLDFYLIPREKKRTIAPDGRITLDSEEGIYIIQAVSIKDYAQRTRDRLAYEAEQTANAKTNVIESLRGKEFSVEFK